MADETCGSTCVGGCDSGCFGSCKNKCGGCDNTCSARCKDNCYNACVAACEQTCKSGCEGNCVEKCSESCHDGCKDHCFKGCLEGCLYECKEDCKGYCAEYCQAYCEAEQVFTDNISGNVANPIGETKFSWTDNNAIAYDKTINITASDWNKLRKKVSASVAYCGGTELSKSDVLPNAPIRASDYNDLAGGLELTNVTANVTLITAKIIDLLRTEFNSREIADPKAPAGCTNIQNDVGPNTCCQEEMTCMADGQLLPHQKVYEDCAPNDQTETKCKDQTTSTKG